MAIALVGGTQKAGSQATASGDLTVSFPANTTAGNLLAVLVTSFSSTTISYTVTDQAGGNALAAAVAFAFDAGWDIKSAIYYLANCPGGISGIKVTGSPADRQFTVAIAEFSGAETSSPLDGAGATASGTGNGTSATSGNCTPAADGDLIFGGGTNGGLIDGIATTSAVGGAYTLLFTASATTGMDSIAEYQVQGAHAAVAATYTLGRTTQWWALVAAFKAAAAPAAYVPCDTPHAPQHQPVMAQ